MTKQRVHMPRKEFYALKEGYEITKELVLGVAGYKLYYMLNNAHSRTIRREDYKGVEYRLGAYREGMDNLKKHRPDLYKKFLRMIRTYLDNEMNGDYAPTIHRTAQHYEWETIDILTAKEHKDLDNAKPTIIRGQFVLGKKSTSKGKGKPLTMEIIKKVSEGKKFPSITKAIEYIEKEFAIKASTIYKIIDTGESIKTEKGSFEILRAESNDKIREMRMKEFYEAQVKIFPQLPELMKRFRQYIERLQTPEGQRIHNLMMKLSKIKQKGYKLKREGYKGLKIKWVC